MNRCEPQQFSAEPGYEWSSLDVLWCAILLAASATILLSGLSVRSLWGSEGRWAVVVREMLSSGNYFLPTINGTVYFDKPLLSYWAILPFALRHGVTEVAARAPGVAAGMASVLLIFVMGRRLFGSKTGFLAALLLLTSGMFLFWARTASAEMLNSFMIWLMFWVFLCGGSQGRMGHLMLLYPLGAVASFCKGPVAPAVVFAAITVYSVAGVLLALKERGFNRAVVRQTAVSEFRWLLSPSAAAAICAGVVTFALLLFLPVLTTGSMESVILMWRENILRFFRPFDHVEPPYAYLQHGLVFFLPWSLFFLISLWEARCWDQGMARRWTLLVLVSVFSFFTLSGSRRSYYILPILPALALVTGKTLAGWTDNGDRSASGVVRWIAVCTSALVMIFSAAIPGAHLYLKISAGPSSWAASAAGILGSGASIAFFLKRGMAKGLYLLIAVVFVLELWVFTVGMGVVERNRTFRPFCHEAGTLLAGVNDERIGLFRTNSSSLIYYLERSRLQQLASFEDAERFWRSHPDGFLFVESTDMPDLLAHTSENRLSPVLAQKADPLDKKGRHVLILLALAGHQG
jgi:4-amino-4-deoxy-L-arabinose transferase-like glycosyltransferase